MTSLICRMGPAASARRARATPHRIHLHAPWENCARERPGSRTPCSRTSAADGRAANSRGIRDPSKGFSREQTSRAEPSRAEPSRAEPSRAEPAEPSRAEPSRAEPSRAEPSRAEPSNRAQQEEATRKRIQASLDEETDVIEWAGMRVLDAEAAAALNVAAAKRGPLVLPEDTDLDRLPRAGEMERVLFREFHLAEVPAPTSEEEPGAATAIKRRTRGGRPRDGAFERVSCGRHRTEIPDSWIRAKPPKPSTRVRAGARLFDFPWDASPSPRRAMIMSLVEHQLEGMYDPIRKMTAQGCSRFLGSLAIGVISGICVRMTDLAALAQKPESLRAAMAVVRAGAMARGGDEGSTPGSTAYSMRSAFHRWERHRPTGAYGLEATASRGQAPSPEGIRVVEWVARRATFPTVRNRHKMVQREHSLTPLGPASAESGLRTSPRSEVTVVVTLET